MNPGADRRRRLAELVERELGAPRPFEEVADEIPRLLPDAGEAAEVLRALAKADRARFWLRAERRWTRRLGWRLVRPLMAVSLAGAVVAVAQRALDATAAYLLYLAGVAALYVALQLYLSRWSAATERRLAEIERAHREEMARLLERLRVTR
ncbi:MAG: hypothetical protein D6718_02810 [Acidobacteria bacterium]|nr:MAG: hypothetical protein D6718_02810 [Acidobacteriota bacterium]